MIERATYLKPLIQSKDNGLVKILIGVRRSGKSTILKMLKNQFFSMGILESQIIEINFEMIEFDALKDKNKLHDYVASHTMPNRKIYLFIDEVQEIPEWARIINSLRVTFDSDIYVTGSNARVFAGDHLTYLAGRYLSIDVFPLSLHEMSRFLNLDLTMDVYREWLDSSFPGIVLESNREIRNIMKQDLFDAIFQRDILLKGKIRNENIFYKVARFVLEHIGSLISVHNIRNTLISDGVQLSYEAVDNYIQLMVKSFFLYPCSRYDVAGKEILKTLQKYYVVDLGIRQRMVPNRDANTGRILENTVYLELIKHGYDVYIGKVGRDYEIDFYAVKESRRLYVQVSESIVDPKTREREVKPFTLLHDMSERYLVTLDSFLYASDDYKHVGFIDFLHLID